MSIQHFETYQYREDFFLETLDFDFNQSPSQVEQVERFSIYWIKKGGGTYYIDFKKYEFQDNVLLFLSPGQIFSIVSERIDEAYKISFTKDFYCINIHDKEVACNGVLFNNVYEAPNVQPNKKDTRKLDFILGELKEEFSRKEVAQHDMLQVFLKQFMIFCVRIQKEQSNLKVDEETKLFKDFSTLVEFNFKKLHSVTDYANRLGVSPKSLTKNFQRVGLSSPSSFIKDRIVLEAKRELLYSSLSVKEIAYDLGFNDAAYFTRFFSKAAEKSPMQFRKEFFVQA